MIRTSFRGSSRGTGGPRNHNGRGTIGGVRGPSAPPVPEAPVVVARAPSEPQGPDLSAGPPRLLRDVGGDEVDQHCPRSVQEDWKECKRTPGGVHRWPPHTAWS